MGVTLKFLDSAYRLQIDLCLLVVQNQSLIAIRTRHLMLAPSPPELGRDSG